jgi:hypothetical protein
MVKLIGLLALAQILLIALLYLKLSAIEQRIEGAAQPSVTAEPDARHSEQDNVDAPPGGSQVIDSAEIRRIVREELRAARQEWAAAAGREPDPAGQRIYDEAEMQDRQDRIRSDLDYLKAQDEVSQAELDLLLAEIARLDPERRSEMFKELNRAMNRGEIRGNL